MATLPLLRPAIVLVSSAVLSLSLATAAPTLTARLSHEVVREGETVDLLLRYAGGYPTEAPDLSALAEDFEIVDSRHSQRATVVNGRAESSFDWVMTLIPREVGEVTVPAIRAGNASSLPVTLTVLDGTTSAVTGEAPDLFVETTVEDDSPFVQGQVGYTVRVYDAIGMLQGSLSEPEADGLRIEAASEDRSYETVSNGRRYRVYERRYAMFPQVSGKIVIPPVVLEAVVADRGRGRARGSPSPFDDLFGDPFAGLGGSLLDRMVNPGRTMRVPSDAVTLDVRPRPEGMDGRWFLPARDVQLTESWNPEPPTFRVGEPVTRTVVVRARGAASEQLPALDIPAAPGTRQYEDGSANRTLAAEDGVVSILEQSVAIVPNHPGTVVLPRVEVEWWDVGADEARIASLPERTLEILPASDSAVAMAPPANGDRVAPEVTDRADDDSANDGILSARVPAIGSWIVIIASIVLLAAGALVVPRLRRAQERPTADRPRSWVRAVRAACAAGRPAEARDALLRWSRARWPEESPLHLRAIAGKLHDPSLAEAIVELDRVLYSRAPSASWNGSALWRAFEAARSRRETAPRGHGPTLPELYPDTTCNPAASLAAGASRT